MAVEVGSKDFFCGTAGLSLGAIGGVVGIDGVEFGGCIVGVGVKGFLGGLGGEEAASWGVDAELVVTVGFRSWFFRGFLVVSDVLVFDKGGTDACDFVEGLGGSYGAGSSVWLYVI